MAFFSVVSALLAVGFATESVGLYAHELNVALTTVFLLLSAVLDASTRHGEAPPEKRTCLFGIVAAAAGLLLVPTTPVIRLFAMGLWFWGLDCVTRSRGQLRGASAALAVGCLLVGVFQYVNQTSLVTWYFMQNISTQLSDLGGNAAHFIQKNSASFLELSGNTTLPPPTIGQTFNGLTVFIFTVGACVGGALIAPIRRLPWFFLSLVGVAALYLGYLCLFSFIPELLPAELTQKPDPTFLEKCSFAIKKGLYHVYPLHVPLLLPLLVGIPAGWYLCCLHRRPNQSRVFGSPVFLMVTSLAIIVAVWSFTNIPGSRRSGPLNVVFYKEGLINWMVPNHQRYGSRSSGMFGNLPLMMERMGWKAEVVPEINEDSLKSADILVIMNQKDPLSSDSLRDIDRFVQGGGSLLVLGDHTFAKKPGPPSFVRANVNPAADAEAKLFLNEPIEKTDIRFRFDSAYYFLGGWLHSMQYWPHQTTAHLDDATNESGCVVGASLEIEYPVVPLVIGRYGFADRGDWNAPHRGYMDDGQYSPGMEMLGDLVLVAAQNVGDGRVVVVGDTSGYVNMIQAQTWPFTSRIFHWLGSTGRATVPVWRETLGLLLMLVVSLVALIKSSSRAGYLPIVCLSFLAAGSGSRIALASFNRPEPLRNRVAIVDLSHVGLHSIEGWRDNGIAGVYLNLMRKEYFAIGSLEFDERQILESDLFLTIAPTQPYTNGELRVLEDYMENGGTVMLAVGWEEMAGAKTLLDRFELTIPHRPQGRASVNVRGTNVTPQFWKAWPVLGGETIAELRDDPIIVRKTVGKGQLVVIGDAGFLLNQNLEKEDGGIIPNIRFFEWLLGEIEKKEAS